MSAENTAENTAEQTAAATHRVVLNTEEQYSIWWADRPLPAGWTAEGTEGSREACLAHIGEVWTDMRPLSLRLRMDAVAS
ncbi:MbtH family NRPS accessory protein [Streptomyces sp. NPDC087917]|uniref:MbtH family protein n=1 Tax=unclassified Streptomyces TaxID=2593676 RepID=UPI003430D7C8